MSRGTKMPFSADNFQTYTKRLVTGAALEPLLRACDSYRGLTAPSQKTIAIQDMMTLLDRDVAEGTRRELMESCGRECLGGAILKKALRLADQADNLDDLLARLNDAHIGGGSLRREGDVICAEYHRCYCGSVSKSRTVFSPTYCYCSCGWYKQLFETLLKKAVRVELLESIIQGGGRCRFRIHPQ